MRKGFTLVELSIVLVIIGLLIGGILVGQSLIESAKMQAMIRQLAQFDSAVSTFQSKFKGLPGDYAPISGLAGTAGLSDNDGIISSIGVAGESKTYSGEIGTFWHDLSIAGLSTEGPGSSYAQSGAAGVAGNIIVGSASANAPKAKAGRSGATFIPFSSAGVNYYLLGADTLTSASNWVAVGTGDDTGALLPIDAMALDSKLDDGAANTGNIRNARVSPGANITINDPFGYCYFGADWTLSTEKTACTPSIRMGLSTGDYK